MEPGVIVAKNKLVKVEVAVPPHVAAALQRGTGAETLQEAIESVMPLLGQPKTKKASNPRTTRHPKAEK